jgi:hypothetical protein
MTRMCTLAWARQTHQNMRAHDKPGSDKKTDVLTRFIWTACGLAGTVGFFASFGIFGYGLFVGAPLWYVGGQTIACMWASQMLLDVQEYWAKAASWLWMAKCWLTKKSIHQELEAGFTAAKAKA